MSTTDRPATATGDLAAALVKVQAAMPTVHKGKTARVPMKAGGHYTYTYADLADVSAAILPLLSQHGLAFSCTPRAGERSYELGAVLLHTSGERLEAALPLHGNTAQDIGSSITYGRRYLLGCLTGIVTDDDDDAGAAQGKTQTRGWDGPSTAQLLLAIDADAQRAGVDYAKATERFRAQRGLHLDDLDALDPWVLADLAAAVKARADQVVAEQEAARTEAANTEDQPLTGDTDE